MLKYILKRLGASILILLGVSLILYTLLRCMPTDFVEQKILALTTGGIEVQEDMKRKLYEAYGLDGTIIQGYWKWLTNIARLDFGTSFINGREVLSELFSADRLGTSFLVAAIATVFEFMIAIPLGITAATHQYSIRDYLVTVLVLIGISLPSFFFGQMLKDIFAIKLDWFPVSGLKDAGVTYATTSEAILDYIHHMCLPVFTVVILSIGGRMRMTRTNMLEVLNSDYIRTARAKGLK
ncbi:MAG: ABC transporter permease, partial [Clostridia bacterium]|nr:ABC transporter permease [Clostridia bacterium]